jgi:hypothetical protein
VTHKVKMCVATLNAHAHHIAFETDCGECKWMHYKSTWQEREGMEVYNPNSGETLTCITEKVRLVSVPDSYLCLLYFFK